MVKSKEVKAKRIWEILDQGKKSAIYGALFKKSAVDGALFGLALRTFTKPGVAFYNTPNLAFYVDTTIKRHP